MSIQISKNISLVHHFFYNVHIKKAQLIFASTQKKLCNSGAKPGPRVHFAWMQPEDMIPVKYGKLQHWTTAELVVMYEAAMQYRYVRRKL